MQKITFVDLPSRTTPINATNLNAIQTNVENAINQAKEETLEATINVSLIAVDSVAPDECVEGDKYFNTTNNLIYTATGTNTWGSTGESPIEGIFYIVFEEQTTYAYNGTTLISVGGGAGGGGDNEPIGKVVPMVLETAPDGYLLCDGSIYTKAQYPDLFKIMKNTVFQTDDEEFQVPNIQGKVIVGKKASDSDFAFIGRDGGSKELQEHSHTITAFYGSSAGNYVNSRGTVATVADNITTSSAGTGHSGNLQPYTTLNYFIKAQKTSGDVILSESLPVGTEVDFDGQASDIPVGWEQVNNILWTNSSPNSDFSNQDISINNINDFNYFKIVIRNSKTSSVVYTVDYYKTAYTTINATLNDGSNTYFRNFTFDFTNNKIVASQSSIPGVGYHNETNIPLYIIGMNI